MGQTCGAADPSQWMRMFGVETDSRDTSDLIRTAESISTEKIDELVPRLQQLFGKAPERSVVNERSIRLSVALKEIVEQEAQILHNPIFPALETTTPRRAWRGMMLEDGHGTSTWATSIRRSQSFCSPNSVRSACITATFST